MRLDEARISEKIRFIKDNIFFLEQLGKNSESEFVADKTKFYAAIHALQISIEAMLDILTHIIARFQLGAPKDDRATLEAAREHKLISSDHFQRFLKMNQFRNKVVHGYLDVDAKTVYATLATNLDDFQLFFDDVRRVVEQERANENNSKKKKSNSKK